MNSASLQSVSKGNNDTPIFVILFRLKKLLEKSAAGNLSAAAECRVQLKVSNHTRRWVLKRFLSQCLLKDRILPNSHNTCEIPLQVI